MTTKNSNGRTWTSFLGILIPVLVGMIGGVSWIQSEINKRPTRTETQEMIDRSLLEFRAEIRNLSYQIDRQSEMLEHMNRLIARER